MAPVKQLVVDLPSSRKEAVEVGSRHYFTGMACANGHVEVRVTKSALCLQCARDRQKERLKTPEYREMHRRQTLASRMKALSDPVRRAEMRARECELHRNSIARKQKKAKADSLRNQRPEVKDKHRERDRLRYHKLKHDPDFIALEKQRQAAWVRSNRGRVNAKTAYRRFLRKCATPNWLTSHHLSAIRSFYDDAASMTKVTGDDYEVDHIVPLNGNTVCGLHVPWNLQVLRADENRRKWNRLEVE